MEVELELFGVAVVAQSFNLGKENQMKYRIGNAYCYAS